ncbi:sulfurtransferase TusA family protein [Sphaerisporangium sp. TRM90804]|uniref:sulfurtransferase TusA family protein n=1 Tax=Sphaerisporangium sp. TRM90804 TaxID=3031113 RepID=UPI002447A119|nr:sulfurtransferase TusA family protein [Sphaerisporangium sp. TRM90804]MDH2424575.1 sulfurtransferase TusA family protein [Sphaerisporangium sp. TRM90804]
MTVRRRKTETPAQAPAEKTPAPPVALTIDALGLKCPIPIIMLAAQINDVPLNATVAVLADDPAAFTDVPAWCRLKSHQHVASYDLPQGGWAIHVRRNY